MAQVPAPAAAQVEVLPTSSTTPAALRAVIDQVLGLVPFAPPVGVAYCAAVRDALRTALPAGAVLEVFHRYAELVVCASIDGVACKRVIALA